MPVDELARWLALYKIEKLESRPLPGQQAARGHKVGHQTRMGSRRTPARRGS